MAVKLLPFWIIIAPAVLVLIDRMRMPKAGDTGRHTHIGSMQQPRPAI